MRFVVQALVMSGVGCHHAGLLYEERQNIEFAFRNRDLPILITTTTLGKKCYGCKSVENIKVSRNYLFYNLITYPFLLIKYGY